MHGHGCGSLRQLAHPSWHGQLGWVQCFASPAGGVLDARRRSNAAQLSSSPLLKLPSSPLPSLQPPPSLLPLLSPSLLLLPPSPPPPPSSSLLSPPSSPPLLSLLPSRSCCHRHATGHAMRLCAMVDLTTIVETADPLMLRVLFHALKQLVRSCPLACLRKSDERSTPVPRLPCPRNA